MVSMKDLYPKRETIFVGAPINKQQLEISRTGEMQHEN
jgi:hypothetical protein